MILSRNLMFALTVSGSAALAVLLAVKRRARLVEATAQHEEDLQRWEDDTGNGLPIDITRPIERTL